MGLRNKINNVYKNININDFEDANIAIDASGYTGNFHRNLNKMN